MVIHVLLFVNVRSPLSEFDVGSFPAGIDSISAIFLSILFIIFDHLVPFCLVKFNSSVPILGKNWFNFRCFFCVNFNASFCFYWLWQIFLRILQFFLISGMDFGIFLLLLLQISVHLIAANFGVCYRFAAVFRFWPFCFHSMSAELAIFAIFVEEPIQVSKYLANFSPIWLVWLIQNKNHPNLFGLFIDFCLVKFNHY